jgi:hypothetical protein
MTDGTWIDACHDDCAHPDLDHATSGEPCRASDGTPLPTPAQIAAATRLMLELGVPREEIVDQLQGRASGD